jgi:HK97 family phage prohead protease
MNPKDNIERLINEKEVQFRDFRLTNIETRSNDDGKEELVLEGLACSFEQETVLYAGKGYEYREKIAPTAFDNCDMSDVIFNYNHCGRVYARTRNKSLELSVEEDGLHMRAVLIPEDNGHAELYRDVKSGLIDKMSFAFHVKESSYEYIERADEPTIEIRTVTEIDKLYDVSAVDIPAYDTTSISARGAFDAEREKREAESRKLEEERANKLTLAKARYNYLMED